MRSRTDRMATAALCAVLLWSPAAAQSKKALAELGRLTPPRYAAPLVRTGDPAPVFEEAMRAYADRWYERSADVLRRFVTAEPEDPAGNFFLAVSLMMIDEVGEAEDRIGVVLAAGETPFAHAARFVEAKASIRSGRLDDAERQLSVVGAETGAYVSEAQALLLKVRALRKKR